MLFSRNEKSNGLSIIIVGCGTVGITLIEQLTKEGHNVTVVDKNSDILQELSNLHDIMCVCGNGASFSVLRDAGVKDADLIIAVTESDEFNLLCCAVASSISSECAAIARVRDPDYSSEVGHIKDKLGLAMVINPELEASNEIARILCLPTVLEVSTFAHEKAELVKIRIPQGNMLDGMSVADIGRNTENVLICAVERRSQIFIPSGDFKLEAGDAISFVSPSNVVAKFLKQFGFKTNKVKSAMIIGGSVASYYLGKRLLNDGIKVKIIEKDRTRCEELSILLPDAIIICGNGSDEDLLYEEGIKSTEAFIPLTTSDEENVLLALHAKEISDAKLVTKINRINFKDALNNLDLGSVIYPRYITSEAIVAYVRAKKASLGSNIETLSHMFDHRVEAIEFKIDKESKVTNTPLMKLHLKNNLLICFILRGGKIIIPSGQDCILPDDNVMIVTTHTGFNDISNILD